MNKNSKGFSPITALVILVLVGVAGYFGYQAWKIYSVRSFDECIVAWGSKTENSVCLTKFNKVFVKQGVEQKYAISAAIESVLRPALEIYFYDNKKYPDSLEQMIPDSLAVMPINPLTNEPYSYKVNFDKSDYTISVNLPDGSNYSVSSPK